MIPVLSLKKAVRPNSGRSIGILAVIRQGSSNIAVNSPHVSPTINLHKGERIMFAFLVALMFSLPLSLPAAPISISTVNVAAAATCYGSACNGLSSVTTGCSAGSYVVSEADMYDDSSNYVGIVQRRWSPTCQTAWAEVYSDFRADLVQARINSTSPSNSYTQNNFNVYISRSPMVYATDVSYTSACGQIQEGALLVSVCTP
jgi:hypothetical protein